MNLFEIKQQHGAFKFYLSVILAVIACGYAGYSISKRQLQYAEREIEQLQKTIVNLNEENLTLTRNLNIIGVDLEVSRMANQNSRQLIQQEIEAQRDLRRELSFYQKIMSPELEQEGFVIDAFSIEQTNLANRFRYALVLMQQEKRRNKVRGDINVSIQGSLGGEQQSLNLTKLMTANSDNLAFHFRYFEVLRGELQLPEGFIPEVIKVESKLKGAEWGKDTLRRTFPWPLVREVEDVSNNAINADNAIDAAQ